MSLFSWLHPSKKPALVAEDSSVLPHDATIPFGKMPTGDAALANGQPANRKNERMGRRELLYGVVRQAMTRAGVLSASYKFKVLSLDPRGRQFLVMVDLARTYNGETARLAEIEALIAQGAKSRHDILVTAVYWRMNEHVAVGNPNMQLKQRGAQADLGHDSHPAVLDSAPASDSNPVPLAAETPPPPKPAGRFDPIRADEVAAFKQALAAGATHPAAVAAAAVGLAQGASARGFDGSAKHGPQSYTLLTGFEDTEMGDTAHSTPILSGTQYGDLN